MGRWCDDGTGSQGQVSHETLLCPQLNQVWIGEIGTGQCFGCGEEWRYGHVMRG